MTKDATKPAANGICLVPDCTCKAATRGLCFKHSRHLKRGTPEQKRLALAAQLPDKRLVPGRARGTPTPKRRYAATGTIHGPIVNETMDAMRVTPDRRLGQPTGVDEGLPVRNAIERLLAHMGIQTMKVHGGTMAYDVVKDQYLLVSPIGQITSFRLITVDGQTQMIDLVEREEKPQ